MFLLKFKQYAIAFFLKFDWNRIGI